MTDHDAAAPPPRSSTDASDRTDGDGTDELVARLRRRRAELAAELARLTAPPDEAAAVAFGKRIGDGTTEAVERISTTLTARSIQTSLREVDRALEKVDAGTFGTCDVCGEAIPIERLDARPFTSRCVQHVG